MEKTSDLELLLGLIEGKETRTPLPDSALELAENAMVLEVIAAQPQVRSASEKAYRAYVSQAALGSLRLKELVEICDAMGERGIDMVPQKGMAYGLMFEAGGPTRAMADIDLLVRDRDYDAACGVLQRLSYEEHFPTPIDRIPGHHERCFVRDGRLVEIHRAFLRGKRITVDYDALWRRTLPFESDGISCRRMDADDTFLYHCFHFGMHEFAIGGLRAVWEMRRLMIEDGPELDTCAHRARDWSTRRITWCAMRLLELCFPQPAVRRIDRRTGSGRDGLCGESMDPAQWRERFEPAHAVRVALERLVVRPSLEKLVRPGYLPRHVQLLRKALLVDRLGGVASYLAWYLRARLLVR